MNDYGLAVQSATGATMFDSRKQMSSYVVADYGTASSVDIESDDLVFVQGSSAVSSKIIYADVSLGLPTSTVTFKGFDEATNTSSTVSLSYLHVKPSKDVAVPAGENYGLLVKNPDGSVQFDSRSIQSDAHFAITDYHGRKTLAGDATSAVLITDSAEYVEILRNTQFGGIGNFYSITGIQFFGTGGNSPKFWSYTQVTDPQQNTTRTYQQNLSAILIAELDV